MIDLAQTWDACSSAIIYGGDTERAQKKFEAWCCQTSDERPASVKIKKIVAAQFVDQLLTESGGQPLDWPQIARRVNDILQATPVDDFEQGYWVDINQAVPPEKISFDVDSLKRDLPEDIRSGLNWSPDKQFFFLITVLSPLPAPAMYPDEAETAADAAEDVAETNPRTELDDFVTTLPELRDKEAAALVRARNSVVAAWLWRKFAADTPVARNDIYVSPCCALIPVE